MKKAIFMIIITFLFVNSVNAQDVEYQLTKIKENVSSIKEEIKNLNKNRLNKTYPIGSVYITTTYSSSDAVSKAIGGTWEVYNSGKTIVGVAENDDDFNEVNKTGGTSTTTLSVSNLPEHAHDIPELSGTTSTAGQHSHTMIWGGDTGPVCISYNSGNVRTMNLPYFEYAKVAQESTQAFYTTTSGSHSHNVTTVANTSGTVGESTPFTNLQPYITVYMYKRVG